MDGSLRVNFTQGCPKTAGHGVKRKRRKGKRRLKKAQRCEMSIFILGL